MQDQQAALRRAVTSAATPEATATIESLTCCWTRHVRQWDTAACSTQRTNRRCRSASSPYRQDE